ncbi:MAG: hypothetical protein OJF51_002219 [Nitrospira sp.]|nr:MAG: hypothetical protein OJF51_002219 [Nitrospira sp.]
MLIRTYRDRFCGLSFLQGLTVMRGTIMWWNQSLICIQLVRSSIS